MEHQDIPHDIASLVYKTRKMAGLSQTVLAQYAGVSRSAVVDIEHAKPTVQLSTLLKVFSVLNIRIEFTHPLQDGAEA